jgi:predicted transcriptional regulator
MDIEAAKRASKLLEEIESLERYKKILKDRHNGKVSHFVFVEHYGNNPSTVVFSHEYTPKFIEVAEEIIKDLRVKLSEL